MAACLYLDTSAVLRAILEDGTSPEIETRIARLPPWLPHGFLWSNRRAPFTAYDNSDRRAKRNWPTLNEGSTPCGRDASFGN
jgi:hypothetical protein